MFFMFSAFKQNERMFFFPVIFWEKEREIETDDNFELTKYFDVFFEICKTKSTVEYLSSN